MNAMLINLLQQGLPLERRPFLDMAQRLGLTETQVLDTVRQLRNEGFVRRLGAVFDARRLGYRSCLCAMRLDKEATESVARAVSERGGVTHCYERGWPPALDPSLPGGPNGHPTPNLWFTFAVPDEHFDADLRRLEERVAPHEMRLLPAVRRFKIDVVFDLASRAKGESVPGAPAEVWRRSAAAGEEPPAERPRPFSQRERAVVRALYDLPLLPQPFNPVARGVGLSTSGLLDMLQSWREQGVLRRVALVPRHERLGLKANALCVWNVPDRGVVDAGRRLAALPEVTHCYERPQDDGLPYNLYAMVHRGEWAELPKLFQRISSELGLAGGRMLCSLREFKKTSLQYFVA